MSKIHVCLRMQGSTEWFAGIAYFQNLIQAIASVPEEERSDLKFSLAGTIDQLNLLDSIPQCIDHIYKENNFTIHYQRIVKFLRQRIPFLPSVFQNPRKIDFIYPEFAGIRASYNWGSWIYDFQHCHMPENFSPQEIRLRNSYFQKIAQSAPLIILSSQMAKNDFCNLFPKESFRSEVLNFVTWLNPKWFQADPRETQKKYNLPDKFILVSNKFWKHKDHITVFNALRLLKQQGTDFTVVCTGDTLDHRQPHYYDDLLKSIEQLGLGEQVKILGFIPRFNQIQLMRRSMAVIQPSLFEGWSTVVEDARALGKTQFLSDFPVHLEQNPPFSYFFKRQYAEGLALLLKQVLPKLICGPDLAREDNARRDNRKHLLNYGKHFLKIIRNIVNKKYSS